MTRKWFAKSKLYKDINGMQNIKKLKNFIRFEQKVWQRFLYRRKRIKLYKKWPKSIKKV